MRRIAVIAGAVLITAALLAACGGDGGGEEADGDGSVTAGVDASSTTEPLDNSPFCQAIRALEALGNEPDGGGGTAEEVLAQNEAVTALIDDATASAPVDSPPAVQALFDDYLLLSAAVVAAQGDTAVAFDTLTREQPELMARLSEPDAHRAAFSFFAERCGTAPP